MSARTKTRITKHPEKLGIIAGGGDIPQQLIDVCAEQGIQTVVVGLQGFAENINVDLWARIGSGRKIVDFFNHENVSDIVFIGAVKKPNLFNLWPDWETFLFFLRVWVGSFGDSKILDRAREVLREHDLNVRGVHEFLPSLLTDEGFYSTNQDIGKYQRDIETGILAAKQLGVEDKGQAVIVKDGVTIGFEDNKGTSALIRRKGQEGAVLVKMCKPQQDKNLDLPTIGANTVEECAKKQMAGIVIEANNSLIVDKDAVKQAADAHGLFVYGVTPNG